MLIAPETLLERLDDPRLRICDVRWFLTEPGRGRAEYEQAHIPGAIFVDVDRDLVAPTGPGRHPLPSPADFARRMGELGIGPEHEVVAYDQGGGTIAARLWWMLDAIGHPRAGLLDGGLAAWTAIGGPLDATVPDHPPVTLAPRRSTWPGTIDREALAASLGSVRLVDVRAAERYRGKVEPVDPVAGHIPSAVNLPTTGHLGPDGRFLPPAAIAARFREAGVDGDGPTVVHCGSGVNACHTLFALRLAGLPGATLYPGSYSDWSRSGMPVRSGQEPGEPTTDPQ
ncbi:MAG TPA: sulfurtransferase [Candidatus Limnocylindrales bacterium]|nr:sulfurtransferase [Candidatus Limnocylindrales bacterium]